jgi:serine/threonine protein kinase
MLVGDLPWSGVDSYPQLVKHILSGKLSVPVQVSRATRELLAGMLQLTPRSRWSTERIKRHLEKALFSLGKSKTRSLRIVTLYPRL